MYNKYMGNTQNKNKINTNINTNPSLKNDMKAYYSSILNKLQYVINHSKNKKIISIIPKQNDPYIHGYENNYNCNSEYKGIIIKYDNGDLLNVSCDSIESDVIMWYYDINNKTNTTYINDDFKKYIKKNIQKS